MSKQGVNEETQYFERIFNVTSQGIVFVNQDGIILRVNPAFVKIMGYEENEILGKPFYLLAYKNQKMQKITSHNSLHRFYCSENASMEMTLFDKQGHDIPVRFRSVFIRDKHDQIKQAIGMFERMVELTGTGERKSNLAEKIWEAQQNFENVLNNSADAIIICDISGTIMMANNAFSQMLDYNQEEVIGKHVVEFTAFEEGTYITSTGEKVIIDEEYVTYTASRSAELFEKGSVSRWESHLVKKDKVHIPVEITMSVLKDMDGERRGSLIILRDTTERKKTEGETKNARDFLENIFKTSVDGIMVTNKGVVTMVNEAIEKMTGYSKKEIIGKHTFELSPGEKVYQKKGEELVEKLFEEGTVVGEEMTWLKKDGSLINIEMNAAILKDDKGNITSVSGIRDITERKKSADEIKETKDFLENIFRTSADGIFTTDKGGVITMVNDAMEKILGYAKDEVIGKHSRELIPPGKAYEEEGLAFVKKLFEEETILGRERILLKKDGSLVDIEQSATFLRDKEGNLTGSVSSFRDITERKQAREALKKSEERYHNLIEFANIGIIVSEKNKILHMNKNAEAIYGYSKEELLDQSPSILVPEKFRQQHRHLFNERFKKGQEIQMIYEEEGIKKDGTIFPLEISFALTSPQENTIIAVMRDITERKAMEFKLLQSEKLKSLGELSGGVAHDFNNVLAAILGRVQLLKMQLKPPLEKQEKRKSVLELKKGLEIIEKASLDGAETVRRIQEFSRRRIDDRDFTRVGINELLDNALEFTRVRWKNQAESKGIKVNIKKELSPLTPTLGSSSEIREVFTNLINNAIDAMPQGGEIRIQSLMDGTNVVVKIEDTGKGIPKNIKDRVFDPFFTTKGPQSTGLGLSVSYGIINRHHGTITVDSVEGEGTTFTIRFPVTKKIDQGNVKEEKVISIKKKQKKARILVIEDEEDVRQLLKDILTNAGHEVEVAKNGSEGITLFKEKEYDLVFTDLGMPVMSGWEVAEKIKSINGEVPVALITGWNVELECSEMSDSGINLVIHKPFKMEQVLNSVQEGMLLRDQLKAV